MLMSRTDKEFLRRLRFCPKCTALKPSNRLARGACPIHNRRFANVDHMSIAQLTEIVSQRLEMCKNILLLSKNISKLGKRRAKRKYLYNQRVVKVLDYYIEKSMF